MKLLQIGMLFLWVSFSVYGQRAEHDSSKVVLFSNALKTHLAKYNYKIDNAFEKKDFKRSRFLFDSLVKYHLVGTQFEDYTLKCYKRNVFRFSAIKKPIVLLTHSSWTVPSKGEFQALNKLALKYGDKVAFVVLFWDRKENLKKIVSKFNALITVCYAHERYKNDAYTVAHLKHSLGFPTLYVIDRDKKVVQITRAGVQQKLSTPFATAVNINYLFFKKNIDCLFNNTVKHDSI